MPSKRRKGPSNVNRLLDPRFASAGGGEWRYWDGEGRLWTGAEIDADLDRVERLFLDPTVVVIVQREHRIEPVAVASRREAWAEAAHTLSTVVALASADDRMLLLHDDR